MTPEKNNTDNAIGIKASIGITLVRLSVMKVKADAIMAIIVKRKPT
jgi:hypothetical protein